MAIHVGSLCYVMKYLDEDKSWELFCEIAFAQEGCPHELEKIGKKIVKECKGLLLSIVVIGGLLRKSNKTQGYWENIAEHKNSILYSREDEQSLDILSLSYSHLPTRLKPCFLYTGIFPKDHKIHVSQLIKLWVFEGFLKPNRKQSLEEIADGYLKDLVDRNLILVRKLGRNGKIKTCNIHDLLRDLCLKVAQKQNFLCVIRVRDIPQDIEKERCIVCHERITEEKYLLPIFHALELASLTRSFVSNGVQLPSKFRLLGVLNVVQIDSLDDIFKQVNFRYVCASHFGRFVPSSNMLTALIPLLWNLYTLIIRAQNLFVALPKIWEMPQLRHVEFHQICLPELP